MRLLLCYGVVLISLNVVFSVEDVIETFFRQKMCAGCIEEVHYDQISECRMPLCCSNRNSSSPLPTHDDVGSGMLVNNNILPAFSVFKPSVYCVDADRIELQWQANPGTFYSIEYISDDNANFTPLTRCGQEIIAGLSPGIVYTIILHSHKIVNDDLILEYSGAMKIKTKDTSKLDPVENFTLIGYETIDQNVEISVAWNNSNNLACSFHILAFGEEIYHQEKLAEPFVRHTTQIPGFEFNQEYSLGIMATSEFSGQMESEKTWLNITVPSCFELEHPDYCVPEEPKNVTVEEHPEKYDVENKMFVYNIILYWEKPIVDPEYYEAKVQNFINNNYVTNATIPGNMTTFTFTNIKVGSQYQIALTAISKSGASNSAVIHRHSNGAYPDIDQTQSWISMNIIIMLTVCPIIILGIMAICIGNYFTKKTKKMDVAGYTEKQPVTMVISNFTISDDTDKPDEWELDSIKLNITDYLGEGEFGVVKKGWYNKCDGIRLEVAIKMPRDNATEEEKRQLAQEIELMKSVPSHPHLVSLIGCITRGNTLLVTEFCAKGNLQSYLRNAWKKLSKLYINRQRYLIESNEFVNNLYELTDGTLDDIPQPQLLISFARQITVGMEYLSSIKLIHRDLAARNILISDKDTVKISDFGLSRDVYYNNVYQKITEGKLPIRWMALESMTHQIYTTQSDVWSFGVLLWEIVTFGSTPYPGISNQQLLGLLQKGYRMEKPDNCNQDIYDIMLKCWTASPIERPSFKDLRERFEGFQEEVSHYINLGFKEINTLNK